MNLLDEFATDCPYCGERITLLVDASCAEQSYIEDCEVCCQPMVVHVVVDESGQLRLSAGREDD
jgi:hypothetical protein